MVPPNSKPRLTWFPPVRLGLKADLTTQLTLAITRDLPRAVLTFLFVALFPLVCILHINRLSSFHHSVYFNSRHPSLFCCADVVIFIPSGILGWVNTYFKARSAMSGHPSVFMKLALFCLCCNRTLCGRS